MLKSSKRRRPTQQQNRIHLGNGDIVSGIKVTMTQMCSRIECVINIARAAKTQGIPIACATSGIREIVDQHMGSLGLDQLFEHVVCVGELPPGRGKPHPDVYLEAARRIGVDPAKCRAYEDGETGMQSAHDAGMHVIDVRDMPGYPLCDGLKVAMAKEKEAGYSWL